MGFDLSVIELSRKDNIRRITLPQRLTLELAELIGIIIGDGHLSVLNRFNKRSSKFIQSEVFISCNREESDYIHHIQNLFFSLFNCNLSYREDKRSKSILLTTYSKGIVQFLNQICQISIGKKADIATIPFIIKNADNNIKCAFLRGLADTDFTISFKNKSKKGYNYPVIRGNFKSKYLV